MRERAYVSVKPDGPEVSWALVVDGLRVADLSYLDVCDLITATNSALRAGRPHGVMINDTQLSFVETLELQMQATSSLRY